MKLRVVKQYNLTNRLREKCARRNLNTIDSPDAGIITNINAIVVEVNVRTQRLLYTFILQSSVEACQLPAAETDNTHLQVSD